MVLKVSREIIGDKLVLEPRVLLLPDKSEIPNVGYSLSSLSLMINSDFYKEFAGYLFYTSLFQPASLVVFNDSEILAQNVKVQFAQAKLDKFQILDSSDYPTKPRYAGIPMPHVKPIRNELIRASVDDVGNNWEVSLEMGNIQPGAKVWSDTFYVGASLPYELELIAVVYADNIKPFKVNLNLSLKPQRNEVSLNELIDVANKSRE